MGVFRSLSIFALLLIGVASAPAQEATDRSVQASPAVKPAAAAAEDTAAEASPVAAGKRVVSVGALVPKTAMAVQMTGAIDSGKLHNGQTVAAKLSSDVRTSRGTVLRAGTPVTLTVIATVPAGKLTSAGEFSLQVVRVGRTDVLTDTLTFRGKQGHRDVADSTPDKGSDAMLDAGAKLTFHVQAQPTMASGPPERLPVTPGSVDGTANGDVGPVKKP